jgi:hypothetical protein
MIEKCIGGSDHSSDQRFKAMVSGVDSGSIRKGDYVAVGVKSMKKRGNNSCETSPLVLAITKH